MPILVDTSVWIDFFRGKPTEEVNRFKSLIGYEEILVGDLILAELLQGIDHDSEFTRVEVALDAFRIMPLVGEKIAWQSAVNFRQLRKEGITVRKTIDCLIATWCIQNNISLLHADRDYHSFVTLGLIEA